MKKFLWTMLPMLFLLLPLQAGDVLVQREDSLGELNRLLCEIRKKHHVSAVPPAGDAIFCRRVHLDLTGTLPAPADIRAFLRDQDPGKREKLIDKLLDSPEYADLMAMRFADMFRIKSEFPINLWPNAVQLFHRYLRDAAVADRSWQELSREMLTGCGSNFRIPEANFFRAAADRSPAGLARITALSFLGMRTERMTPEMQKAFAGFFSRVCYKGTDEWKEEIVIVNPIPMQVNAMTPDGKKFTISAPGQDPREVFADWLLAPENPYFSRAAANRIWAWIFGKGVADPADDMPLPLQLNFWQRLTGSRPAPERTLSPELLDFLGRTFAENGYRFKPFLKLLLNSDAYQADWRPAHPEEAEAARNCFATYPVRRLDAELIVDMLAGITRRYDKYSSVIPEPFTFLPAKYPSVCIADGSISSVVLENFGRPPRDSGLLAERKNIITASQRQYLMNSSTIYDRLNTRLRDLLRGRRRMPERRIAEELYLLVLSRFPTPQEEEQIKTYYENLPKRDRQRCWNDLLWVLVNTREFLYRH